jgi:hypothetical protein
MPSFRGLDLSAPRPALIELCGIGSTVEIAFGNDKLFLADIVQKVVLCTSSIFLRNLLVGEV